MKKSKSWTINQKLMKYDANLRHKQNKWKLSFYGSRKKLANKIDEMKIVRRTDSVSILIVLSFLAMLTVISDAAPPSKSKSNAGKRRKPPSFKYQQSTVANQFTGSPQDASDMSRLKNLL